MEPNVVVESLIEIRESLGPSYSRSLNEYLAGVLAAAGDFPQAETHVAQTEGNHINTELRFLLAREKAKRGADPTGDLHTVRLDIERFCIRFPLGGVENYAELAAVSYETTGVYPSSDLSLSETLLTENERQYPTDRLVTGWHGDVAQAFASCGNFEEAQKHERLIMGHSPIETMLIRSRALRHIGEKQLAFGNSLGAAETGREAVRLIESTPIELPHLVAHLLHEQTFGVATLWPLVARAEAKLGLDPSPSFQHAEESIQSIDDGYWTARALATLALAKKATGRDPYLTMNRAWVTLMDMPNGKDYDFFDRIQRLDGLRELAGVFIELGDPHGARGTLADLARAASEDDFVDVTSDVAVLLADIAVAEMKRGGLP